MLFDKPISTLIVIFSVFLNGCFFDEPKEKVLQDGFPVTIHPELKEVPQIDIICPEELIVVDGYLVIINNCHEKVLQIVSLSDRQSKTFISKGNGPSEMRQAYFSGHKSGDSLMLMDAPGNYAWIHPARMFHESDYSVMKIQGTYIPPQNMNVFQIKDQWVYNDLEGEGYLVIKDRNGMMTESVDYYPASEYANDQSRAYVYYSWSRYNDRHQTLVSALRYFPFIIFTDIEAGRQRIVQTRSSYNKPVFINGMPEDGVPVYNLGLQTSDDYIYMYNPGFNTGEPETEIDPAIEVYNWKGDPMLELRLNNIVGAVDFDFKTGRGYGLMMFSEENRLGITEIIIPEEHLKYFKY